MRSSAQLITLRMMSLKVSVENLMKRTLDVPAQQILATERSSRYDVSNCSVFPRDARQVTPVRRIAAAGVTRASLGISTLSTLVVAGSAGVDDSFDPLSDGAHVGLHFMAPNSYDCPSGIRELLVDASIPIHVARELVTPERGVCFWHRRVFGTPVPEAAVDKNSDFASDEHDIRLARQPLPKPVAQPTVPQLPSKVKLRARIAAFDGRHAPTPLSGAQHIRHFTALSCRASRFRERGKGRSEDVGC